MRRSLPSLRKPPPLPRDTLLASDAGQENKVKPWTTFSDLHRRHLNSDYLGQNPTSNVKEEAGSKPESGQPPSSNSTPLKFCFGSTSTRHQQPRDAASQDSLPDLDELFEDRRTLPDSQRSTKRLKRRQKSPMSECTTSALDHNSGIEHSPSQDDFMEAWLLSDAVDHSLRSRSPTPVDSDSLLPRSRSIASNTPYALDEIDKFLSDVSSALSPPSISPFAGEQGVRVRGKSLQVDNNEAAQEPKGRDANPKDPCVDEQGRASQSSQSPPHFTVPIDADKFAERLQELRAKFQQELDAYFVYERDVESLRREVETALSSQKAALVDQGNAIQRRAKGLQHEAASLYTKGKSELNP
ncbi:unnamed protein product [Mortierella alpina]